jgi:hypothetical protein
MQRSKKYIADYLRTMPAGTQVALFEFSPLQRPGSLQGFTTDGPAAAAAVDNLDVEWIHPSIVALPHPIAYLHQIAAYVAGIHGRKNLIWISSGSPLPILHDGGLSWGIRDMIIRPSPHGPLRPSSPASRSPSIPLDPRGVHGFGRTSNVAQLNALMKQNVADETGGASQQLQRLPKHHRQPR